MAHDAIAAHLHVWHSTADTWVPASDPGFGLPSFDSLIITYTDSTKATISTVVYKMGATTVATLTLVQATLTDTYTKT